MTAMADCINFLITCFGNVWIFATTYWITSIPLALFAIKKVYDLYRRVKG